ncbi:hypothetical protein P4O66_013564 [Electrophorus voltai]|uniref:C2 domain-containing protein n=1 Tax=Electrophorus voltai TaxID=2609070 RepID=A0AAD8Z344_9TELE|nr:hypothetical protein P4O66_013564 [Electrophorus voltai]
MSSVNKNEEQRWVPTHVQVLVVRARGLRAKGKHGTSDVYTLIQVGKEKYSTCVMEKTTEPEWGEECSFELLPGILEEGGRDVCPPGNCDLTLTVMHRALIGLDVFLGQAVIPLDKAFNDRTCMKNEWCRLHSKTGKKEKERGELQVTVQFTRHNLTASMYDLSLKDKPRSAFIRLRERMRARKRNNDEESSSAIVPGGYGVLTRVRGRLPSDGGGEEDYEDDEGEQTVAPSPQVSPDRHLFYDEACDASIPLALSATTNVDGLILLPSVCVNGNPVETSPLTHQPPSLILQQPKPQIQIQQEPTKTPPQTSPPEKAILTGAQTAQPSEPKHPPGPEPQVQPLKAEFKPSRPEHQFPALGVLQKGSPLSLSLQNLSRRGEEQQGGGPLDGRRWSFDKPGEKEKAAIAAELEHVVFVADDAVEATGTVSETEVHSKKRRGLFSHGRVESAGKGQGAGKDETGHTQNIAEGKQRGWFTSKDTYSKPSPHPVKPLTPPDEKKSEGRSVLEKLKSTIHPGRGHHGDQELEKKPLVEGGGSYYHLNHSELVSLLLQRDTELQDEREEYERRGVLLEKREVEIKKMKFLIRDLEDYIDTLLVRIMEQTPALLQVRPKMK